MASSGRKGSPISVGNWMWTLLLSVIPGINILFFIITACVTRKSSKRTWAIANILWMVIIAGIIYCVIHFFGQALLDWMIRLATTPVTELFGGLPGGATAAPTIAPTIAPTSMPLVP